MRSKDVLLHACLLNLLLCHAAAFLSDSIGLKRRSWMAIGDDVEENAANLSKKSYFDDMKQSDNPVATPETNVRKEKKKGIKVLGV